MQLFYWRLCFFFMAISGSTGGGALFLLSVSVCGHKSHTGSGEAWGLH